MPGHKVAWSRYAYRSSVDKYQCPSCNHLLKDAVQLLVCGHWLCECCADELLAESLPKCPKVDCQKFLKSDKELEGTECFPDKFLRREIEGMIVGCPHQQKGCQWEGRVAKLETHLKTCDFVSVECNLCGGVLTPDQIESHGRVCPKALKKCPLAEFGCHRTDTMTQEQLKQHVNDHGLEHLQSVADMLKLVKSSRHQSVDIHDEPIDQNVSFARCGDFVEKDGAGENQTRGRVEDQEFLHTDLRQTDEEIAERAKSNRSQAKHPGKPGFGCSHTGLVTTEIIPESERFLQDESVQRLRLSALAGVKDDCHLSSGSEKKHVCGACCCSMNALREYDRGKSSESVEHREDILKQVEDKKNALKNEVAKFEKATQSKRAEFEQRKFRLSLIESSNHDVWRIPQFSQRMANAQSGRYTSIFSIPFYTEQIGYKMCLRLNILGDGIGKNTHMSLFFVIMKGEFDNVLQWPFTSKVTFKLINQTGGKDIIDTVQPDSMNNSFLKPKSDMNIASGCPRFVSHTELKNGGFIVEDTVFVKYSVDCATVKHP